MTPRSVPGCRLVSSRRTVPLKPRVESRENAHRHEGRRNVHPTVKNTIYLDGSGRIARIDIDTSVVTFSRFGVPVSIQAPM